MKIDADEAMHELEQECESAGMSDPHATIEATPRAALTAARGLTPPLAYTRRRLAVEITPQLIERFWPKVNKTETCWLWTSTINSSGYGQISKGFGAKTKWYAHRVVYEMLVGPIPDGFQIDHLCRVRTCVNPDHLEAVTQAENIRRSGASDANRARHASRTHCKRGHPFDEKNTIVERKGRSCRTCKVEHLRQWRARQKAAS